MATLKDIKGVYLWEYEESLEEALGIISPYDMNINILCEDHDRERQFRVGDILMVPQWHSSVSGRNESPHRIIVVTVAVDSSDSDIINYSGYLLSSQIDKANINNEKYPNNIYINNYDSILREGRTYSNRPVILKVDELITFTNQDLRDKGTWKGHISDEFSTFMDTCVRNYRLNRIMNRTVYWNKERSNNE